MANICYFEIPVNDIARAQAFYAQLFDWRFEKMPGTAPEFDYWSVDTGTPNEPGVAFGGMMKRQAPGHQVTQYVSVTSLDRSLEKAQSLGATVLVPRTAVSGKGFFAICRDLDGNPFGLWECDMSAE